MLYSWNHFIQIINFTGCCIIFPSAHRQLLRKRSGGSCRRSLGKCTLSWNLPKDCPNLHILKDKAEIIWISRCVYWEMKCETAITHVNSNIKDKDEINEWISITLSTYKFTKTIVKWVLGQVCLGLEYSGATLSCQTQVRKPSHHYMYLIYLQSDQTQKI